ncbi:hypothetical protein SAMN05444172_9279 [Burkholderia sp. GAS332]|nr:hypothetical protein SAMN05444172_9279 [Burkholderia sp. GAS332]
MNLTRVALVPMVTALSVFSAASSADPTIDPTLVANSAREARMVAAEVNARARAASAGAPAAPVLTRQPAGPSPANHNEDNTRVRQTANPL